MGLEDDASRVLKILAESPDENGVRSYVAAAKIHQRLPMSILQINDAIRWMESRGWIDVRRSAGMAPFLFDSAQIKPDGIIEYDRQQKQLGERRPPARDMQKWIPFNKGSLEHRGELEKLEAELERAQSNRRSMENQLRGGRDEDDWEPEGEPDEDVDPIDAIYEEEKAAAAAVAIARKALEEAERQENVDFTRTAIHALSDDPIDNPALDALGFEDLANSFAAVLDSPRTAGPLVAAISGPWGSGKSSIANLVANRLRTKTASGAESPHVVAQFNAWMHQDAKRIEIALMSHLARAIHDRRNHVPMLGIPMQFLRPHQRCWRIAIYAMLLAFCLAVAVAELHWLDWPATSPWIAAVALAGAIAASLAPNALGLAKWIVNYASRPAAETEAGTLKEARDSWADYVQKRLPPRVRLMVFLEDLDRCSPQQTIRLIECINQLLPNQRTIVILVGDMKVLAQHVGAEWLRPIKPKATMDEQFEAGSRFLQKIVQLRFEIPQVTEDVILPFISKAAQAPPKQRPWYKRPMEAWRREQEEWRRSTWARPRKMRNPYWGRGTTPVQWVIGFLWEPLHVIRMALHWIRYWIVPRDLKPEFKPKGAVWMIGLRSLLVLVEISLLAVAVSKLANTQSNLMLLLASTLVMAAAVPSFMLLFYGTPTAVLSGLGMGIYLRFAYRRREDKKGEQPTKWLDEQRHAHGASSPPEYPSEDDGVLGAALRSALEHAKHPRMAKRIVTRLRFELLCINGRGLLVKGGPSPQMLGAWVVFMERWPSLYQRVLDDPGLFTKWERNPNLLAKESDGAEAMRFFQRPLNLSRHVRTFLNYRASPEAS